MRSFVATLAVSLALSLALLPAVGRAAEDSQTEGDESKSIFTLLWEAVNADPDEAQEARFIAYPVIAFAPETSWEFGVSALYVYYAKDNPKNRLSEIGGLAFITLQSQWGLLLDHAIYTDNDDWFFLGRARFQSFPLRYFGIGPDTLPDYRALVQQKTLVLRERALRKIIPSLYVGAQVGFDVVAGTSFDFREGVEDTSLPTGAGGSENVSLGVGVLFDNRHNVLNVRNGLFSELAFLHSNRAWGSDFSFSTVVSDTRWYRSVNKTDVIAAQLFGQFTFGNVPFNNLSTLGGESLLRGYYLGRFRDRHFVGTQLEYRMLPFSFLSDYEFFRRLGAVAFAATGAVFPDLSGPKADSFVLAGGLGLRLLLFPDKDIFSRLDVAFTKEGPGYYLFVGEAF